jgi:hypothetical protein
MALLSGIQRRYLPGQVVIPRPGAELMDTHRHNPLKANPVNLAVSQVAELPSMQKVCGTSDLESWRGT